MEVPAKEGTIYLQVVKFGKKYWKRTWMMLFPASSLGIGRVELCNTCGGASSFGLMLPGHRKPARKVIRLTDCLSVCPAPEESCPQDCMAFYLNTTQRTYTLATEPVEDWVSKLCLLAFQKNDGQQNRNRPEELLMEDNELYSSWKTEAQTDQYKVTIQKTEAAVRCNLAGSYLLSLNDDAISLLDPLTAQTIYSWPYPFLRRFGQDKDTITIEAGRRCDSGEGHFTFLSKNVAQIYKGIEEAIAMQHATSQTPKASSKAPTINVSGKMTEQMDSLDSCPDKTIPTVPPRKSFLPDISGKLPQQQTSYPQSETMMYALQKPAREKPFLAVLANQTRSEREWVEEEAEYDLEEEERLCSLESICLDDFKDDAWAMKPSVHYKAGECLGGGDMEAQQAQKDYYGSEYLHSLVNSPARNSREHSEDSGVSFLNRNPSSIVTTTEIPVDFKEKLSNILFKDLAKVPAPFCIKYTDTAKPFCDQDKPKEGLDN